MPEGLYRAVIAGPGRSLSDAFANLERSPNVSRVLRHEARDLLSARVTLAPEEGSGYFELTRVRNDLYIILSNFIYKDPRFEFVPGDGLVQFNFKLSGDLSYGVSRPGPLRFNRPSLHVWRQPQGIDMHEWTAPSAQERNVSISVRPEFLTEHLLPSSAEVPPRLQAFVAPPGSRIDYCQMPLTAQMLEITQKLIDNPYTGALYLTYLEALTLELLCAAVGNFWSLPGRPAEEYSERELQALAKARQLLMEQLAPPPTLRAIARAVALSEKALTHGFRTVYGETVFDFSLRCRMQYALTLLRDRHWSVDQVSEAAGYSHPTSFATAFRRHFGMRPIDFKRLKSSRNS
jgi:AraC-like DNA-binding protein